MRILFVSALVLVLLSGGLSAQQHTPAKVCVVSAQTGAPLTPVQEQAYTEVTKCLAALAVPASAKEEEYVLFVDAASQGDAIALTLIMGHALPPEAIEAGSKAEVMYAGMLPEKRGALPAEGKWVREMVSADFMRQFWMPLETKLMIVKNGELAAAVKQETTAWYQKYLVGEPHPY
jgi:hypothetical protein